MGRIITGLLLVCGWFLLLFKGGLAVFNVAILACGGVALHEFLLMSMQDGQARYIFPVLAVGLLPLLGVSLAGGPGLVSGLFLAFFILILLTVIVFPALENGMEFICQQWFGIFYIGFCGAHLILLRTLPEGIYWLLVLTGVTVCSDTAAYYVGRMLGKTKLYPALSPGKTRAGAIGGILGGTAGGVTVTAVMFQSPNLVLVGLLCLILSIIGIIGDLIESLIKRISGVKDSGQILPGHGGFLDRCDSIILTAPVMYYFLYWGHAALLN
jgi:phosphatidate cytidylyltransferase